VNIDLFSEKGVSYISLEKRIKTDRKK